MRIIFNSMLIYKKPKPGRYPSRFINPISSQLVELGCHRGLLVGCVVLVQQALCGRTVDCLNSNFIGVDGIILSLQKI